MLYFDVRRGENTGIRLTPHKFKDKTFHVAKKKGDQYVHLETEEQVVQYLRSGYSLRMSNRKENHAPSLIAPESICGWDKP
jgi:hypothetical protein